MAKPIPNAHVMAEPWFQQLREMQQARGKVYRSVSGLLENAPAPRTLLAAAIEVRQTRAKIAGVDNRTFSC